MAAKDPPNGSGCSLMAELEQLTLDAAIAPSWILATEAQDEFAQLG